MLIDVITEFPLDIPENRYKSGMPDLDGDGIKFDSTFASKRPSTNRALSRSHPLVRFISLSSKTRTLLDL